MGSIGSRENGLNTIGKRDLTIHFTENREIALSPGVGKTNFIPGRIFSGNVLRPGWCLSVLSQILDLAVVRSVISRGFNFALLTFKS